MAEKKEYLPELMKLIKKYGLTMDEDGTDYIRINLPNLTVPDDSFADLDKDDDELIYYKELALTYDAETNSSHIEFVGDGYNRTGCVSGLKKFETVVKKLIKVADVYNSMNKQLKSKVKEIGIAEDF
ncbi:MAG: hypothetical protein J6V44_13455 [Methanobrevibacter sp.]|nr:hypothetical protein [Methanobrevibacter sp.]